MYHMKKKYNLHLNKNLWYSKQATRKMKCQKINKFRCDKNASYMTPLGFEILMFI